MARPGLEDTVASRGRISVHEGFCGVQLSLEWKRAMSRPSSSPDTKRCRFHWTNIADWQDIRCDSVWGGGRGVILPLCFRCAPKRAPPASCCVGEMRQHKEQVQRVVIKWHHRRHPGQSADCLRKRLARTERGVGVYTLLPQQQHSNFDTYSRR